MMDLRALMLKSFLSQGGAAEQTSAAPGLGASAAVGERTEIEAPSAHDVLQLHDSLVPVAAPSHPLQKLHVHLLVTASVAVIAILVLFGVLYASHQVQASAAVTRGVGRHGVALARYVVARAAVTQTAPLAAPSPAKSEGSARSAAKATSKGRRAASSHPHGAAGSGKTAAPALAGTGAQRGTPASVAEAPAAPLSLVDAMAAAVADPPHSAASTAPSKPSGEPSAQ